MLAVKLTLVRISGGTVFTQSFLPAADAIDSLIAQDPVTRLQVGDFLSNFQHLSAELMPKNLSLLGKRNLSPLGIQIVIAMPFVDVKIRPAHAHRFDFQHDFIGCESWIRNFSDHEL